MTHPLTLVGNEGSPYSRKMRAVLRYRGIPYRWVTSMGPEHRPTPKVPVQVIPVLVWHDDGGAMREAMVDSTPQIRRLEKEFPGRSILHPDPALEFLSSLIEDYADEWCTKFMFHYRWADAAGIAWASRQLGREINPSIPQAQLEAIGNQFAGRQTGRRWVVGSNDITAPVIEAGFRRVLGLLDELLQKRLFLFGQRPTAADFALYGQFWQLCHWDPTSAAIAREGAPRVTAWTTRLDDLSGWPASDEAWLGREAVIPALEPLLAEIAATYVPFLLANATARAAGQDTLECQIDGARWQQTVFPYQVKCLGWLREHYASLSASDQDFVGAILERAGGEEILAARVRPITSG